MRRTLQAARAVLTPVLVLMLVAGCAEVRFLSQAAKEVTPAQTTRTTAGAPLEYGYYKVGNPYQIKDVWYYPHVDYRYVETGIASWYGPNFHGKRTANGVIFDMNKVSAAHRTLPMPSYVRVTNLNNGRSLDVLINDRGPFARGRIIDLSRRAAELLGFKEQGTAPVRVEILADRSRHAAALAQGLKVDGQPATLVAMETEPDAAPVVSVEPIAGTGGPAPATPPRPPAPADPGATQIAVLQDDAVVRQTPPGAAPTIFVQAGAFSRYDNALRTKTRLAGVGAVEMSQIDSAGAPLFRVRVGPVASVGDADALLEAIAQAGYPEARIVVD